MDVRYEHTHADGVTRSAESVEEVVQVCSALGRLGIEAASLILNASASGKREMEDERQRLLVDDEPVFDDSLEPLDQLVLSDTLFVSDEPIIESEPEPPVTPPVLVVQKTPVTLESKPIPNTIDIPAEIVVLETTETVDEPVELAETPEEIVEPETVVVEASVAEEEIIEPIVEQPVLAYIAPLLPPPQVVKSALPNPATDELPVSLETPVIPEPVTRLKPPLTFESVPHEPQTVEIEQTDQEPLLAAIIGETVTPELPSPAEISLPEPVLELLQTIEANDPEHSEPVQERPTLVIEVVERIHQTIEQGENREIPAAMIIELEAAVDELLAVLEHPFSEEERTALLATLSSMTTTQLEHVFDELYSPDLENEGTHELKIQPKILAGLLTDIEQTVERLIGKFALIRAEQTA